MTLLTAAATLTGLYIAVLLAATAYRLLYGPDPHKDALGPIPHPPSPPQRPTKAHTHDWQWPARPRGWGDSVPLNSPPKHYASASWGLLRYWEANNAAS